MARKRPRPTSDDGSTAWHAGSQFSLSPGHRDFDDGKGFCKK